MRNKANFRWRRVGRGPGDGGRWVECAKRSQFRAVPAGTRSWGRGPWRAIVQSKANLGVGVRKWARRRQIWDPCRGRWCKTKPIPAMAGGAGLNDGDSGVPPSPLWPLAFPGPVVQTKPICLGAIWRANAVWKESYDKLDPRMAPAEQSQFPPPPQWPGTGMAACAVGGTHRAKRTQYPAGPGGRGASGCRAKQTQFGGRRDGGEMCETNPIGEEVPSVKCQVPSQPSRASRLRGLPTSDFTLHTSAGPPADSLYKRCDSRGKNGVDSWTATGTMGKSQEIL